MPRASDLAKAPKRASVRRPRVNETRRDELSAQLDEILLTEGFIGLTMDDLVQRVGCSKATLYSIAGSKEQLVVAVTKRFFRGAAEEIEAAVAAQPDVRQRIATYLAGVGTAMRRQAPAFYGDMVAFEPTASIYLHNSDTAARRVRELIEDGVRQGVFRSVDGAFAAQLITLAIDGIQSGAMLRTTGLSAGDAFAELGDLLLNGLSTGGA